MEDLISLARNLIVKAGGEGLELIRQKSIATKLFQDYIFASFYHGMSAQNSDPVKPFLELNGSRAGNINKYAKLYKNSRKAAFDLLLELLGRDQELLPQFIIQDMASIAKRMPIPEGWGIRPAVMSSK